MSLAVSPALLEQAERGEVDAAAFVDTVRASLPYAYQLIDRLRLSPFKMKAFWKDDFHRGDWNGCRPRIRFESRELAFRKCESSRMRHGVEIANLGIDRSVLRFTAVAAMPSLQV